MCQNLVQPLPDINVTNWLEIPTHPPQLSREITKSSRYIKINVTITLEDGTLEDVVIDVMVTTTPGEYYDDVNTGRSNRRYGGKYEKMAVYIPVGVNPLERVRVRDYGLYNRQIVNDQPQWVRIDHEDDFLHIDNSAIQQIEPIIPDKEWIINHIFTPITICREYDIRKIPKPEPYRKSSIVLYKSIRRVFNIYGIWIEVEICLTLRQNSETMTFIMYKPKESIFEADESHVREYGTYLYEKISDTGDYRWVRMDEYEDYLGIDNTSLIQDINSYDDEHYEDEDA